MWIPSQAGMAFELYRMLKRILVLLTIFALLSSVSNVSASLYDELKSNLDEQERLKGLIKETQQKERTLASQISYMNNQMRLTQLRIEEAETKIKQLGEQIEQLNGDIGLLSEKVLRLEESRNQIATISAQRVRASHESSYVQPFEYLLDSRGFGNLITKFHYLSVVRQQDVRLLKQMKETQESYLEQKQLLSDKKVQVENLRGQVTKEKANLEYRKKELAIQKKDKENLLSITKNDEANYQRLLEQIQNEFRSIQNALASQGTKIGSVKKGDKIAIEGNNGCVWPKPTPQDPTAGSHLHFGLRVNGKAVDPIPYLNSGELGWPQVNPIITQGFGENYSLYMSLFGIPGHDAIDMTVEYGAPIFAAADGEAMLYTDPGCGSGPGKGLIIDHGNGMKTIYWHIQ
jgi:peptidoglycan hydrolase CwlO-like protein